jgi:hypothetical protein
MPRAGHNLSDISFSLFTARAAINTFSETEGRRRPFLILTPQQILFTDCSQTLHKISRFASYLIKGSVTFRRLEL